MLRSCATAAVMSLALAGPSGADVWDGLDEDASTANQLAHGAEQLHDLAARGLTPDQDWFRVSVPARSSFEVVVDGVASDVGSDSDQFLTLVHSAGDLVEVSAPLLPGRAGRSLSVENATVADYVGKYARVRSQGCGTSCGREAVYAIRGYDTTCAIPRFNNSATQATILVLQNAAVTSLAPTATGHVWFWSEAGALLASQEFSLDRWQTLVLNTATLPGAAGAKGSMTISYKGGYGQLAGKAIALEPATGFTFETNLVPRPR
jgi:hypothetical protein